jgi:hypothetical protein
MWKKSVLLVIALFSVGVLVAGDGKEIKGHNGLYMGHSFFWPSVRELEKLIPDSAVKGHKQCLVKAGGTGGSPANLWKNPKTRYAGQRHLNTKKIDLLVMTYYSPKDSSVDHYSQWFDYAIKQNPATTFMVTIPWGKSLYKADQEKLDDLKKRSTQRLYDALIVKLRKRYPKNTILYCPYGLGTYELTKRLKDGKLTGVKYILNLDKQKRNGSKQKKEQLLNDELGHPGELVAKLGALLWFQTLYDYDLSELKTKRIKGLPDIDIKEIAATVSKQIKPLNAAYKKK